MKLKLKGRVISIKRANAETLKRIIKVCEILKQNQTKCSIQWSDFVILMLKNKLKRVSSYPIETTLNLPYKIN